MKCNCESSYCEHIHGAPHGMCRNDADGTVRMEYVGVICAECAASVTVHGGSEYLTYRKDVPSWEQARMWLNDTDLSLNPTAYVNGVLYVLDYGDGNTLERMPWGERLAGPVFVWKAAYDPDYVAPPHVSEAAYEYLTVSDEVQRLETAAGWDRNP